MTSPKPAVRAAARLAVPAVTLAALLLAATAAAAAQGAADPVWRKAPLYGADVRSLAVAPDDPDTVFAGTSGGQVYVSHDGGASWADAGASRALPGWVVSDLEFDPERPGRLWAALWGIWGGGQVVMSDDGGRHWLARGEALSGTQVYTLATVPGRPDRLYAGSLNGVWGTADAGLTWRRLTSELPEAHKVTSLMVPPGRPESVYAGTWERAFRSDDGGRTWRGIFDGMILDSEVFTLTPIPDRPGELWASTCGWVYQSLDGGGHWQRFSEGFEQRRTPSFAALPNGRLLAGTVEGLHVSDDRGRHWRRVGPGALSILDIAFHPERPSRVYLATEGSGVWISDDGGDHLRRSTRGMTNLHVAAMTRAGREVLVAVNHAGPASGVYSSLDGGRSFGGEPASLPTVLSLAIHEPGVYAATEKGLWERSGGAWRRIGELGDGRVEQVVADGGRLLARTAAGLWELAGPRFQPVAYKHGAPHSAVLADGAVWVSDGEGLYRLTADANHTIPAPFADGQLDRFADRLLLYGKGGVWLRGLSSRRSDEPWVQLAGGPARALPTGDPRWPALVAGEDGLALMHAESGTLQPLDFPFPASAVTSALIEGDRLLIGTSGQGLLWSELPAAPAPPPPAPPTLDAGR